MPPQPSTQAVHAGEEQRKPYGAVTTPIVQTSVFSFKDTADILDFMQAKEAGLRPAQYEYGRYGNPTLQAAEAKLAALEGGEQAVLFASGMSAITTSLLTLLSQGDHLLLTGDCYHRTREFALSLLSRWGIETSLVDSAQIGAMEGAIQPNTRLAAPWMAHNWVLMLSKLIRILYSPYHRDNWTDIIGYATLVLNSLDERVSHVVVMKDQDAVLRVVKMEDKDA